MNAVDDDGDYWDDDDAYDDYAGDDYDADGVGMIDEAKDEADSGYTEQLCVLDDCQFDLCDDLDQPNSDHGEGFFQKHTSAQHMQASTLAVDKCLRSREPGIGKTFSKKYPGSPTILNSRRSCTFLIFFFVFCFFLFLLFCFCFVFVLF